MKPRYLRGLSLTGYGVSLSVGVGHPDAVAKMAIEIIKMSDPGRETEQD